MAKRKNKSLAVVGGDLVGWLLVNMFAATNCPDKLPRGAALNPFAGEPEVSEELRAHLEGWSRDLWRGMVNASTE